MITGSKIQGGGLSHSRAIMGSHLAKVVKVASDFGLDISGYLAELGLPGKPSDYEQREFSIDTYNALLRRILEKHQIPAFGFKVGREFRVVDYGVVGYATLTSSNLRDALNVWCKYQHTIGHEDVLDERLVVQDDTAVVSLASRHSSELLYRYEIEQAIGQWSVAGTIESPEPMFTFTRVLCTYAKPDYAADLAEYLNCPILFGQNVNEIHFPSDELDNEFALSSEVVAEVCEEQCRIILERLNEQSSLVEKVRRLIVDSPGKPPKLEDVARDLNMSPRSLRRNLQSEASSFQQILNEVQMVLAGEYLSQTKLSVKETSYLLGYSEVANFHRAFKRWYDITPTEYREQRQTPVE